MTSFEMIKYHGQEYPADVPLHIEEIAAHFDITNVGGKLGRSLHTEYSYGKPVVFSSENSAGFLWKQYGKFFCGLLLTKATMMRDT